MSKSKLLSFRYVLFFYLFLYVFNNPILFKILGSVFSTGMFIAAIIILIVTRKIKKIYYYQLGIIIISMIVFLVQIQNNYYLLEGRSTDVWRFSVCLLIPFMITIKDDLIPLFHKFLKFFGLEHVFATIFVQIFPVFYMNNIMPWLFKGRDVTAYQNLKMGFNPGITSMYSMNGTFITYAILALFTEYISKKKKSTLILLVCSFLALLFSAKRAHLLFSVLSCVFIYFEVNKERYSKKIIRLITGIFIAIIAIFVMSTFVPEVKNVFYRFEEGYAEGNLLNGRNELYDLALKIWKNNPIFGSGWGAFSYIYKLNYHWDNLEYLDVHNVYLQLLCECGVIGLSFFLIIVIFILIKSIKVNKNEKIRNNSTILALGYQIFFLLYCFSGNPLYDNFCYTFYFMSIGIIMNTYYKNKNRFKGEKNGKK